MDAPDPRHDAWFMGLTDTPAYPYQTSLALADELPELLAVPTGCGKTAAVVLAWLWRLRHAPEPVGGATPRRLVYCLPRRTLVTQVAAQVKKWLERDGCGDAIGVHVVMGGEHPNRWWLAPEAPAVLVGTADMLLSRTLNRGYASPRNRWPQEFGLLNNDCLWIIDEVQLFEDGLSTTAQLAGLRRALGYYGRTQTLWMSATLHRESLDTVDHPAEGLRLVALGEDDRRQPALRRRLQAPKRLHAFRDDPSPASVAKAVTASHHSGTLTLVICNTPERAAAVYRALPGGAFERLLVHGRFRTSERQALSDRLTEPLTAGGRIAVCTQVVEAGVDIDARTLWTDLAPWSSLVQRFGRCNRAGAAPNGADVHWMDVLALKEGERGPYTDAALHEARDRLSGLEGQTVAPEALTPDAPRMAGGHVLRRADLMGLFDTAPDLSGNDLDVSRFIQAEGARDVFVFWRALAGPPPDIPPPHALELCPVPIGQAQAFVKRLRGEVSARRYDHLEDAWVAVGPNDLRPGHILLYSTEAGGYDVDLGWTGDPRTAPVPVVHPPATAGRGTSASDGTATDLESQAPPQTIAEHTDRVCHRLDLILSELERAFPSPQAVQALRLAARYHDAGKAHPAFQETMRRCGAADRPETLWAKAPNSGVRHRRKHLRHEWASLLLFAAAHGWRHDAATDLAAYLVLSHHGKVRLAVRSFPDEIQGGRRRVLGIQEVAATDRADDVTEALPPVIDLGSGVTVPGGRLQMGLVEMGCDAAGRPSWLERSLGLRDSLDWGPFRLAYLEALLRAADARADGPPPAVGTRGDQTQRDDAGKEGAARGA